MTETNVDQVAELLLAARSVIIVPGYGMAVAQAQHPVKEISSLLIEKGDQGAATRSTRSRAACPGT